MEKHLTWEDIEKAVVTLSEWVPAKHIDVIAGISRGGEIPAILLGRRLNKKVVFVDPNSSLEDLKGPLRVLFVDDIYDTGATQKKIQVLAGKPHVYPSFVYVCSKQHGVVSAIDFVNDPAWIVFPWEKE